MGRTLALLALVISSIGPVPCARADGPVVLARLPVERHDEMMAALRLELAGRAEVVDGPVIDGDAITEGLRVEARSAGATHAVWIEFPGGALRPAEVRALHVERTAPAHAMTPQAWDVVDARLVAVIAGSLLDAVASEPVAPTDPAAVAEADDDAVGEREPIASERVVETETETETEPEPEAGVGAAGTSAVGPTAASEAPAPDPRRARRFSLIVGAGLGHMTSPMLSGPFPPPTERSFSYAFEGAFYGRLTDWASIGLRLRLGSFGYSSIEGVVLSGAIGVPSLMVSFREALGTAAVIELGIHAEGGLFFYGRNVSEWSFGLGVGAFATLELGRSQGIQVDYTLDLYGFGASGSYAWGSGSLSYVVRFD